LGKLICVLFFGLIAVAVVLFVSLYNKLVKLRNMCDQAWSDIDVQLQRRYDLVPNLVETVKGYASHEKGTLEAVIKARQQAVDIKADDLVQKANAENVLTKTLRQLFAVAEAYPDLKANQNFLELQNELTQIEDHLQQARRYYNAVVRDNNNAVDMFPSNIIANMFHFSRREYFELENQEAKQAPKVKF
jgi:LemA protein